MIRAVESPIAQTKARVRAWIASIEKGDRTQAAVKAGVDEKNLRLAAKPGRWNPTTDTLEKLHAVVPSDFRAAKRGRAA